MHCSRPQSSVHLPKSTFLSKSGSAGLVPQPPNTVVPVGVAVRIAIAERLWGAHPRKPRSLSQLQDLSFSPFNSTRNSQDVLPTCRFHLFSACFHCGPHKNLNRFKLRSRGKDVSTAVCISSRPYSGATWLQLFGRWQQGQQRLYL